MELTAKKITPCLWFDTQAEEAAKFYASIFKNSKIGKISRYGKEGFEIHGKKAGTVMTVEFEMEGQEFLALNGGPHFKFNEAVSLAQGQVRPLMAGHPEGAARDARGRKFRNGATGHAVDAADAQDRPRGAKTSASGLNAGHCAIATTSPNDFDNFPKRLRQRREDHADTVSVLRRPLRGGDRVLQEGAGRRGQDDDALQGKPGAAAARHGSAR